MHTFNKYGLRPIVAKCKNRLCNLAEMNCFLEHEHNCKMNSKALWQEHKSSIDEELF